MPGNEFRGQWVKETLFARLSVIPHVLTELRVVSSDQRVTCTLALTPFSRLNRQFDRGRTYSIVYGYDPTVL